MTTVFPFSDSFLSRFFQKTPDMKAVYLLTCMSIILGSADSFGQSRIEGVKIGLNIADVSGSTGYTENQSISTFSAGVFTSLDAGLFAIQPELLYTTKGYKLTSKVELQDVGAPIPQTNTVVQTGHNSYLEIPILLKLNIPSSSFGIIKPNIFVGPAVAFELRSKINVERSLQPLDNEEIPNSGSNDFGIILGVGADINLPAMTLLFDLRYDIGMKSLNFSQAPSQIKNRVFTLNAGIGM